MKAKIVLCILFTVCLFSCDDNTGNLGIGMFPGDDQGVNGKLKRYQIETSSKALKKIFARTGIGYVGRFTDPDFGPYEAGFLTQFSCPEGFEFPKVYDKNDPNDRTNPKAIMVKDEIYRTELILRYKKFFGDSITPSHLSVYLLDKKLDAKAAKYTDINPAEFYNESNPSSLIGSKTYTAIDYSVKDSIRNLSTYIPSLFVSLPTEIGQQLLEKSRELGKEKFHEEFKNLLKGIYVKCDGAESNILYIDQVELRMIFESYYRDEKTDTILKKKVKPVDATEYEDSTGYRYRLFAATREIVQANSLQIDPAIIEQKINEPNYTYMKTPAGIYTQATMPFQQMSEELANDTLNVAKVTFSSFNDNMSNPEFAYPLEVPEYMLLIREKDRDAFFENNKINDNITSYLGQRIKNRYSFQDLSQLINISMNERKKAEDEIQEKGSVTIETPQGSKQVSSIEEWERETEWDKVALIPVAVSIDQNKNNMVTAINMELQPSMAKLQGGHKADGSPIYTDLEVVYTSFK